MSSNFLTGLANMIEDKYGLGENQNRTLDIVEHGHVKKYGKLGDFANKFDQSAERKYLNEGYVRLDPFNVNPQQFELLLQEPDATVLIKKRAFSTLSENYRSDFMDQEEKLYFKATKILFQNKCKQIAAFERLSKIERIGAAAGQLDDQLMPLIISLVDVAAGGITDIGSAASSDLSGFANSSDASAFKKLNNVIDKIRKIYAFGPTNNYTTWVADQTNIFKTDFAQGTGVIELTNVMDLRTNTSVKFNNGSFSLTISDPYKMMLITDYDIEKAISDASNYVSNKKLFQLGQDSVAKIANNNIKRLNDARLARGASAIEFITSPDTVIGKKVRALIENSGIEINFNYNPIPSLSKLVNDGGVNVSQESLRGGPEVGDEGLDNGKLASTGGIRRVASVNEVKLFQDAVSAIFTVLEYDKSAQSSIARQSDFTVSNDPSSKLPLDLNYVRRKLRLHYGNKLIIQPMDRVHIYLGSKSRNDNKILSGLQNMFTGLGFFQQLNNNVYDLKNQIDTLFNPSQNIGMQLEKSVFVGPDFPNGLWAMMRNLFVNDKSGCHVFGGVVSDAGLHYAPGTYSVNITGKDNSTFFDFGPINLNPGVDTFNGPLYDPLTPFKTKIDVVSTNFKDQHPELLEENKALIQTQTADEGLIKYKSGRHAGKPATLDNFHQDKEITKSGIVRNIYHAPDGLVYRWKEGIGTLVYSGDSFNATNPEKISTPAITRDPFAGQDVINVLSLLITGVPYNFATYYKAVREFDNFGRNPQTGQDPAISFYNSLNTNLKKNNFLWGNFIPFKNLVIDDASFQASLNAQATILDQNSKITDKLSKIQDLKNKVFIAGAVATDTNPNSKTILSKLKDSLQAEQASLQQQTDLIKGNIQPNIPISTIGNDVSFDPDQAQGKSQQHLTDPNVRAELRKKNTLLTKRLSWAVRANEDKNLLIIDDSYDKDYDILAFDKKLKGKIEQFSNSYTTVKEKISTVANLLNLEVFCDTQGHLRIRPPQYNRMPSSVFYRMMQMKQNNGIQVFPDYLKTLFTDQLNTLLQRVEVLELMIRLDGAILGINDDAKLSQYLNAKASGGSFASFTFFSDQNGNIQPDTFPNLLDLAKSPEDQIKLNTFDSVLASQNSLTSVFNALDRASLVSAVASNQITASTTNTSVNFYITRIFNKTGQHITLDNFLVAQPDGVIISPSLSQVDAVKLTQDLANKVSKRQQVIKLISSAFKNAKEFISLDADPKNTGNSLLFPNLYGNSHVPEVFAHMIEDESYDDFGPGSGTRYIIKDHQILDLTINEAPPPFTTIEVRGQSDPFINEDDLSSNGLNNAFPGGGNAIITAAAVDYDLWRMYGFRNAHEIHAPYISDPETQGAPYAASLLSRARKEILQGQLTISGNEYMQPGEVIYIESFRLLFYVESVSHNFSFGNNFTTTLTLSYGHNYGEYIPTPLDIMGKILYNNRDTSSIINYRQSNIYNESQLGAIVINPQITEDETELDMITKGTYGEFNLKIINDILYSSAGIVATNSANNSNVSVKVELRAFFNSNNGGIDPRLQDARNTLKQILTDTASIDIKSLTTKPKLKFSDKDIELVDVDISDTNERRSPSQRAMDIARNLIKNTPGLAGIGNGNGSILQFNNPLINAISSNVIDCVITFSNGG